MVIKDVIIELFDLQDVDESEIDYEQLLADKYTINVEMFEAIVKDLAMLTPDQPTALGNARYKGFVTKKNDRFVYKIKLEKKSTTLT
jgi:hypothetical protein